MVPRLGAHGTVRVRDPHVCPRSLLLPTQVRRERLRPRLQYVAGEG